MGLPVLILLAIAWAAFLLPPIVRNRAAVRPGRSVNTFRHDLAVLGRATPGTTGRRSSLAGAARLPGTPTSRAQVRRRRRDVLAVLAGLAVFTLLLALAFGGPLILAHLLVDAALAGYVYLLVQLRKDAAGRPVPVRYVPPAPTVSHLVTVRRSVG
ncbi:MAG: hypothetical protein GXY13_01410 [Acidimicrobiales bacterium]|nr:hypothetical protein [Acidimicrobiales bacterium]